MSFLTKVKIPKVKYSKQNLSHDNKLTLKYGVLTPILCQDILPGDKVKLSALHQIRTAPHLFPTMHKVDIYKYFFFVPNRLIHDEHEDYMAGKIDDREPYTHYNTVPLEFRKAGTLWDYLGYPTSEDSESGEKNDALTLAPFMAYQLIYNEYFRDQNLVAEVPLNKESGYKNGSAVSYLFQLRNKAWTKDYFTAALPTSQVGQRITLPVQQSKLLPVSYDNTGQTNIVDENGNFVPDGSLSSQNGYDGKTHIVNGNNGRNMNVDNSSNLKVHADKGELSLPSIIDLRRQAKLQQFAELQNRTGSRYIEMLQAFFNVISSDARLQRPEYLCGLKDTLLMNEIEQTSQTTNDSALGELGGRGESLANSFAFSRRFEEHGWLIGIMVVLPKASYFQGLPRKFTRKNRFDYYWPQFQNLGDQEIKCKELYFTDDAEYNESTFGYAPRYSEYKYSPNEIHGEFRTNLNFMHMARIFDNKPYLNRSFIEFQPDSVDRVHAVNTGISAPLYAQIYFDINMLRPMQYYDEPQL